MTDLTHTRILMLEIRDRLDRHIVINDSIVKSLHFYLQTKSYGTITIIHGSEFMDELIKLYEECELYEECAEMLKQAKDIAILIDHVLSKD